MVVLLWGMQNPVRKNKRKRNYFFAFFFNLHYISCTHKHTEQGINIYYQFEREREGGVKLNNLFPFLQKRKFQFTVLWNSDLNFQKHLIHIATMQVSFSYFPQEGGVEMARIWMESCLALIAIHDHVQITD